MSKVIGSAIPNLPWQDKPEGYSMPLWRYTGNPIIGRHALKRSNSVLSVGGALQGRFRRGVPLRQPVGEHGHFPGVQQGWHPLGNPGGAGGVPGGRPGDYPAGVPV